MAMTNVRVGSAVALGAVLLFSWGCGPGPQRQADDFMEAYDQLVLQVYPVVAEAYWKSSTDVTEKHVGERIGA